MLQVGWENYRLIPSFAGKLDAKIPGIKCDECELEVLGCNVLGVEVVEAFDGVAEGAGVADLVPGQSGQASCERFEVSGECTKGAEKTYCTTR